MAKKWVPKHVKPRLGIYTGMILFQVIQTLTTMSTCTQGYTVVTVFQFYLLLLIVLG